MGESGESGGNRAAVTDSHVAAAKRVGAVRVIRRARFALTYEKKEMS